MNDSTRAYTGGVIEVKCSKCGAEPFARCKHPSGYGTMRIVRPHAIRIREAKEKREREQ